MKLTAKAKKALKESIEHWYRISACMTPDELKEEGFREDHCPLCKAYPSYGCIGCPVSQVTRLRGCNGSPYIEAELSLDYFLSYPEEWTKQDQANVEAEIRFLESILEDAD